MKFILYFISFLLCSSQVFAQCATAGQSPETALPVCTKTVFHQKKVPACVNNTIPVPTCVSDRVSYQDESPFWYKFTCFKGGKLVFLIKPDNPTDDYDWELFDITGKDPKDVYTQSSLVVGGNWSGEKGNTGATTTAKSTMVCATLGNGLRRPLFSKSPTLIKGHTYLLLVSHFSGSSQSGYDLSFGGGSAMIADTTTPAIEKVEMNCNGKSMIVYLTKEMKCNSLSLDGSDFLITDSNIGIQSAESTACMDGFGMKKLKLILTGRLSPGSYHLKIENGKDGNTLLDNCGAAIQVGDSVNFTYNAPQPVPMDSIADIGCAPKAVRVTFADVIKNNSVADDGSDFKIINTNTGGTVDILGAESLNKEQNGSRSFKIRFKDPIYREGHYRLILQKGSDGNTVISECDIASRAGEYLTFDSYDTVRAKINTGFNYSCNEAVVQLSNPGGNGINSWRWSTDTGLISKNTQIGYQDTSFRKRTFQLEVSNGVCEDKRKKTITPDMDYYVKADFSSPAFVCPQDAVTLEDESRGNDIIRWHWNYGRGRTSYRKNPETFQFPTTRFTQEYPVQLIVANSKNCRDTAAKIIKVINTCEVYVPSAFTPNGDGENDRLSPLNAYVAKELIFKVYNRYGQQIFRTRDWTKGWDGTYKGKKQPQGAYIWTLRFINSRTGEKVSRKGTSLLIQ